VMWPVEGLPVVVVSHKTEYGHYDQAPVNLRESAREWMQERGFFAANGYGIPAKLREVAQATNVVVTLGFEGLLVQHRWKANIAPIAYPPSTRRRRTS
jgi:hypothetical protein